MPRSAPGSCRALAALLLTVLAAAARAQSSAYPSDYEPKPFSLPAPDGRYSVGTRTLAIGVQGGAPLEAIVWYPAASTHGKRAPYFSLAERKIEQPAILRNFRWPRALLDHLASAPIHSFQDAPAFRGRFPVVIFSHGYWSYPRQNTALMEALASHGYVVFSLAHPGDAADLPSPNGIEPTIPYDRSKTPDSTQLNGFWAGTTDGGRRAAFPGFWRALEGSRLLASLERWRADILRLAGVVTGGRSGGLPEDLAPAIDPSRIAFAGMSFGGSASASACQRQVRCRAVVNLDGFEFDQRLYNRGLRVPLLLIQSDWHVYPNSGPPNACFTAYDYAYEPWSHRGSTVPVYRYSVRGIRHMGLTDLVLAPRDKVRDDLFGTAEGNEVVAAVNSTVLAFLDHNLKGRHADVVTAALRHPILERHVRFAKPIGCTVGAAG